MGDRKAQTPGRSLPSASEPRQTRQREAAASPRTSNGTASRLSLGAEHRQLDTVPASKFFYLLTPYLNAPPPHVQEHDLEMDPFEPLGRKIATHHKYVRHTPYIASKGLEHTHEMELDEAGAVLVVICQPPTSSHLVADERSDKLDDQQRVAEAVSDFLEDELAQEIPAILLCIGAECAQFAFHKVFNVASWSELCEIDNAIFAEN